MLKSGVHATLVGVALLTDIGFTVSLFIGKLAFADVEYLSAFRLGVLGGSILSAFVGIAVLLLSTSPSKNN